MTWRALTALLSGLLLGVALTQFGLTGMRVSGESMTPTLHGGEFVVLVRPPLHAVFKWFGASGPLLADGAVVALRDPHTPAATGWSGKLVAWATANLLVKRVVGLPGQSLEYRGGKRYVNGATAPEPWLASAYAGQVQFGATTIGPREVYVLGDDRLPLASRDSRTFGALSANDVRGLVVAVLRSPRSVSGGWQWPIVALD